MSIGNVLRIENNTARQLGLPPTTTFPVGIRLLPGMNTVPVGYMAECDALEVETVVNGKVTGKRYPGREAVADFQKRVKIIRPGEPNSTGPQITVFTDDQAGRPDGLPPPDDLLDMKSEIALKMIELTDDKEALKRWFDRDKRKNVKEAAQSKLASL